MEQGRIIAVCGKICSGKTWYAHRLREELHAVVLSTDELTWDLTDNIQGEIYNQIAARANRYLLKKACEIAFSGANVILDWGFWTRKDRLETNEYCRSRNVMTEWHYIDTDRETWLENIQERNARVKIQGGPDFYVDEGLLMKLESLWETPEKEEMDVWFIPQKREEGD